ncbi:dihydrofolate reductase, partial [Cryphonectria parasitica EP155]
ETLTFSDQWAAQLEPYLPPSSPPPPRPSPSPRQPFLTLTYAQSLDAQLASAPGLRTTLSGPASKAMTHYLRARHDAILVGVGTAVADDPGLNCRLRRLVGGGGGKGTTATASSSGEDGRGPRPVILDPGARWRVGSESKVVRLAREGTGLAPWVVCAEGAVVQEEARRTVEGVGGRYLRVAARRVEEEEEEGGRRWRVAWEDVLGLLGRQGVGSLMVEGGGRVVNDLLALGGKNGGDDDDGSSSMVRIDSVIVTIAPVWLGVGGVRVAPGRAVDGSGGPRLKEVTWVQMGEDMVVAGRL